MRGVGALAMFATADVVFMTPSPNRPERSARKAKGAGPIQQALTGLRTGIASILDEGPWLPRVTRNYPY